MNLIHWDIKFVFFHFFLHELQHLSYNLPILAFRRFGNFLTTRAAFSLLITLTAVTQIYAHGLTQVRESRDFNLADVPCVWNQRLCGSNTSICPSETSAYFNETAVFRKVFVLKPEFINSFSRSMEITKVDRLPVRCLEHYIPAHNTMSEWSGVLPRTLMVSVSNPGTETGKLTEYFSGFLQFLQANFGIVP
jgi:hypothetical protein